jgi:hypothetical protein
MGTFLTVVLVIAGVFAVLYAFGMARGEPELESLNAQGLKLQIWALERWINKYQATEHPEYLREKLQRMYEHKKARLEKAKALLPLTEVAGQALKVVGDAATFVGGVVQRAESYAKEHGITRAEAEKRIQQDFEARKQQLIQSGVSPSEAEDRAFREVWKV